MAHAPMSAHRGRTQFTLMALFEYTTLCCFLAACSGLIGIGAALSLMGVGLALVARQGHFALAGLMAAALTARIGAEQSDAFSREFFALVAAFFVCGWYQFRNSRRT